MILYSASYLKVISVIEKASDVLAVVMDDTNPDPMKDYNELTTYEMYILNQFMPDVTGVYYQSYGSYVKPYYPSLTMKMRNKIISQYDGQNDGVVPACSFQWTNFQNYAGENTYFGVSHFDIIGFTNITFFDEKSFFKQIVIDLKKKGF